MGIGARIRKPFSGFGSWLRTLTAETVFTVFAGCWVLFGYFSHDREAKQLQVEQQRLATAQARAVQQTAIETDKARLEQLKLSNELQTRTQSMTVDQQRLTLDQSRLALAVAESQRKLREVELRQSIKLQEQEIALKELQARKAAHEVDYQGKFRFGQTYELTGQKVGGDERSGTYEISHRFQLENKSEAAFELSLYVVDYYIGVPKQAAADAELSVLPLGEPANRWNPRGAKPGGVEWTRVGHSGAIFAAAVGDIQKPWCDAAHVEDLVRGGPGTGVLQPMQTIGHGDKYVVRAPRHSYVAFILSFCTNRCKTNDDLVWRTDVLGLDELEAEQTEKK
jgi:hypothetical protein